MSKVLKKQDLKKDNKKKVVNAKVDTKKESLWVRFRIFLHGVKVETTKVHWPSKYDMIKYSIATVFFIVFCSAFFYVVTLLFAYVQSLFN